MSKRRIYGPHTTGVTHQRREHVRLLFHLLDTGLVSTQTTSDDLAKLMHPCPDELMKKFFIEPDRPYWIDGLYKRNMSL